MPIPHTGFRHQMPGGCGPAPPSRCGTDIAARRVVAPPTDPDGAAACGGPLPTDHTSTMFEVHKASRMFDPIQYMNEMRVDSKARRNHAARRTRHRWHQSTAVRPSACAQRAVGGDLICCGKDLSTCASTTNYPKKIYNSTLYGMTRVCHCAALGKQFSATVRTCFPPLM